MWHGKISWRRKVRVCRREDLVLSKICLNDKLLDVIILSSSSSRRWTSYLKVLAFSMTAFHFPRCWTQAVQFLIFIWQMSCLMLSSHLYLGLPCDLLVRGFQLNIFLTVLVSGILCMWPNQLSLWALMSYIQLRWIILILYTWRRHPNQNY